MFLSFSTHYRLSMLIMKCERILRLKIIIFKVSKILMNEYFVNLKKCHSLSYTLYYSFGIFDLTLLYKRLNNLFILIAQLSAWLGFWHIIPLIFLSQDNQECVISL